MAALAQGREIPRLTERLVRHQMMNREAVSRRWLVDVSASLTLPVGVILDALGDSLPVRGIRASVVHVPTFLKRTDLATTGVVWHTPP